MLTAVPQVPEEEIYNSNRLNIVLEPEAAAMYCCRKSNELLLEVGDTFIVVDAGGGTIDLVRSAFSVLFHKSYWQGMHTFGMIAPILIVFVLKTSHEIVHNPDTGNESLREIHHGSGRSCGSTFINEAFIKFFKD